MKHICTVVMLVCFLFCLCSCHREERESGHTDLVLWDDVYQIQYLTPPDKGVFNGGDALYFLKNNAFFIDDCLFLRGIQDGTMCYFGYDINQTENLQCHVLYQEYHVEDRAFVPLSRGIPFANGNQICLETDADNGTRYRLRRIDSDGKTSAQSEVITFAEDTQGIPDLLIADDGTILIYHYFDDTSLFLFDESLHLIVECDGVPEITDLFRLSSDGDLILECYNDRCYRVNEQNGTLEEVILYQSTDSAAMASEILYDAESCYFVNESGVTRQDKNGVEQQILSFAHSGFSRSQLQFLKVLPGQKFFVRYHDSMTGTSALAILYPTEMAEVPVRTVLTMASIGLRPPERTVLHESVVLFNRENTEYRIEYTDYDALVFGDTEKVYHISGDADASAAELAAYERQNSTLHKDAFEAALLSGTKYDLYAFGPSYDGVNALSEKLIFSDLTAFYETIAMPVGLRNLFGVNRDLIPLAVKVSALITLQDPLYADGITPTELLALRDTLYDDSSDAVLFSANVSKELGAAAVADAMKNKDFTSSEFMELYDIIAQIDTMPTSVDRLEPYIDYSLGNIYGKSFIAQNPIPALCDGRLLFAKWTLTSAQDLSSLLLLTDEVPYALNGYPSKDGGLIYAESAMCFAVGADQKETGAFSYLEMMFSDRIQTAPAVQKIGLPVTESAIRASIQTGWYYANRGGNEVRVSVISDKALSDDEAALYDTSIYADEKTRNQILDFLLSSDYCGKADSVVQNILDEELSAVTAGIRNKEDSAKIIQSRVSIYLSE